MKSAEEWSARIDQEKLLSRSTVKIVKQIRAEALREAARIANYNEDYVTEGMLTAKADEVEKI